MPSQKEVSMILAAGFLTAALFIAYEKIKRKE